MVLTYFSPDTREFIRLLADNEVRYLIVGGEAVIYYGYARLTGDVDFFYESSEVNAKRLFAALDSFWEGEIPGIGSYSELLRKGVIIQFGRPPNRIDLINEISGVSFAEAWPNRTRETIVVEGKDYPVNYIGVDELIRNKSQVNRYKDLDDLKYLKGLKEKE